MLFRSVNNVTTFGEFGRFLALLFAWIDECLERTWSYLLPYDPFDDCEAESHEYPSRHDQMSALLKILRDVEPERGGSDLIHSGLPLSADNSNSIMKAVLAAVAPANVPHGRRYKDEHILLKPLGYGTDPQNPDARAKRPTAVRNLLEGLVAYGYIEKLSSELSEENTGKVTLYRLKTMNRRLEGQPTVEVTMPALARRLGFRQGVDHQNSIARIIQNAGYPDYKQLLGSLYTQRLPAHLYDLADAHVERAHARNRNLAKFRPPCLTHPEI